MIIEIKLFETIPRDVARVIALNMRKRFEQQHELDATLIPEVKIDVKSRHELPKLLAGLQYIFVTPSLNEKILEILEKKILWDKKKTGRMGMSLWEILVLGVMRLNLDIDYDLLHDYANHHNAVRGITRAALRGIRSSYQSSV